MDSLRITGGTPLSGKVAISGAKNAALPIMAASLLTDEPLILRHIPHLSDITTMANLLVHHGVMLSVMSSSHEEGRTLSLCANNINNTTAPYDIVRRMRASVVVLGPLLARFHEATVSMPGGCAIGTRPIDLHLHALEQMGATITLEDGYVHTKIKGRLKGADISFPVVSVGATENAMMAATLADGTSTLRNAAREPEVTDLAECLVKMGAAIEGIGTNTLTIHGKEQLSGAIHTILPDRIEAGSYAIAAAITRGNLTLERVIPEHMATTLATLEQIGVTVSRNQESVIIAAQDPLKPVNLTTSPYPGFATDMQAQFTALLCTIPGTSQVTETIFENRFMHVPELQRMGAKIKQSGHTITIDGIECFHAAEVMATDLRASLSLVLAALAAEGTTTINRIYHIDRGYEQIEEKLGLLGANIERCKTR